MGQQGFADGLKKLVSIILNVNGWVSVAIGGVYTLLGFTGGLTDNFGAHLSTADSIPRILTFALLWASVATASFVIASKLSPRQKVKGKKLAAPTASATYVDPVTGKKTIKLKGYPEEPPSPAEIAEKIKKEETEKQQDFLKRLRLAAGKITDPALKSTMFELEHLSKGIFEQRDKHPSNESGYRKFTGYYMPTTLYLAESYVSAASAESSAPSDRQTDIRRDAKRALLTAKNGFQRIYDNMFEPAVLDIASEAGALEKVLASDGLLDGDLKPDK